MRNRRKGGPQGHGISWLQPLKRHRRREIIGEPSTDLDKYRVDRVLGAGGMGVVVAATHLGLGEQVALKFLLKDAAETPEVVSRFFREAQSAAKLQSEHVARVFDVGRLPDGSPLHGDGDAHGSGSLGAPGDRGTPAEPVAGTLPGPIRASAARCAGATGSPAPARLRISRCEAVKNAMSGKANRHYIEFGLQSGEGVCCQHPCAATHARWGKELTVAIQAAKGW